MAEKFVVLGASSFYGQAFSAYAIEKGDVVRGWRRYAEGAEEGDIVVNFASKSLVAESWEAPEQWCNANLDKLAYMVSNLAKVKIKKFVHVSTPEVYGDMDGWTKEQWRFNPSTPYAVSRAAGDMMLMAYRRAYNFPAVITRTANIYGPSQGANRVIPQLFDHLRNDKPIALHGNGLTRRSFIHVRDACAATYLVAKSGSVGETYHISTTETVTIRALAEKIARLLGKPLSLIGSQPDRLGKDRNYMLDSQKIRNMGWRDKVSLDTGLEEYARGN